VDDRCEAFGTTDTVGAEPDQATDLGRRHDRNALHRLGGCAPHVAARSAVTIADLAFPIDRVLRSAPGCQPRRTHR
jgi:hypothetical protein